MSFKMPLLICTLICVITAITKETEIRKGNTAGYFLKYLIRYNKVKCCKGNYISVVSVGYKKMKEWYVRILSDDL